MLRLYFYVGGMPEAVNTYNNTKDLKAVRERQSFILANYALDFSKHIPVEYRTKVGLIWDSIPLHLGKEKKKFIYKEIKVGGRASEFETALFLLQETGLVYKIHKTLTPKIPLVSYQERDIFKLYMHDVGLLCAKADIDLSLFYLADNSIFNDFQGSLAEQFVLQELKQSYEKPILYWGREKSDAEVDFIMQHKNEVVPIEVKSAWNTRSKSLNAYISLEKPKYAVKLSLNNYAKNGDLYSIPLYMISLLEFF
jgi:predicted AAA+ superfamily ATPase